jgi:hypothetical protein
MIALEMTGAVAAPRTPRETLNSGARQPESCAAAARSADVATL